MFILKGFYIFLSVRVFWEGGGKNDQSSHFEKEEMWDFPGGAVVKNPPANAGDTGSSPGPGRSHMPRSN